MARGQCGVGSCGRVDAGWKALGAWAAAPATAVFAFSRSMVSHAADQGDFTLKVAVDWLHLLLACLWVGVALLGAFVALRETPSTPAARGDCAVWVASLSSFATAALVLIMATGVAKVCSASPSSTRLVGSQCGAVLLVKLALVVVAIGLGGFNRFWAMPTLLASLREATSPNRPTDRLFSRVLQIKAGTLTLVLVATAVLSGTPTPGEG